MADPIDYAKALQGMTPPPGDPSWTRSDGTQKGMGFLGPLLTPDNHVMSENSIGVNIDGKEMEIPSIVPTLTPDEVYHLMSGNAPTQGIVQKAVDHARMRMKNGLPVFK